MTDTVNNSGTNSMILIVDDAPDNLRLPANILKDAGDRFSASIRVFDDRVEIAVAG